MKYSVIMRADTPEKVVDLIASLSPVQRVKDEREYRTLRQMTNEDAIAGYVENIIWILHYKEYRLLCEIVKGLNLKSGRSRKRKQEVIIDYFVEAAKISLSIWRHKVRQANKAIKEQNPFDQMLNDIAIWEEQTGLSFDD